MTQFYSDPKLANFLSEDPAREYMNPYAYVAWNPVRFTDPTGMMGALWGGPLGFTSLGYNGFDDSGKFAAAAATKITGSASVGANFGGPSPGGGGVGAAVGAVLSALLGIRGVSGGLQPTLGSLAADFDASFSVGGLRIGGVETGRAMGGNGFTAGTLTWSSLVPGSFGQLMASPLTLAAALAFFVLSGFDVPVQVRFGDSGVSLFGGNPSNGFLTLGGAMWGPSDVYQAAQLGIVSGVDATFLAHEFGHVGQSGVLGPAFLAAYVAQFPAAIAALQNPFQFNILENFFLGGSATTYDLQKF